MSSFMWAGMKALSVEQEKQAKEIANMDLRIQNLENLLASSTPQHPPTGGLEPASFFGLITGFFKDAYNLVIENGLLKIAEIITDKITTKEFCVDDVCVTRDQFKELLEKNNILTNQPGAELPSAEVAPSEPPAPSAVEEEPPPEEPVPEPEPDATSTGDLPSTSDNIGSGTAEPEPELVPVETPAIEPTPEAPAQ